MVIHEYIDFDCPHCPGVHQAVRSQMARKLGKIRLVRHDYARMRCAPNDAEKRRRNCELVRGGICAAAQIDYWQWNDTIIAAPRHESKVPSDDYLASVQKKLGLDNDAFEKCLFDAATVERAQSIYQSTRKMGVTGTPTYIVDGEKRSVSEVLEMISAL